MESLVIGDKGCEITTVVAAMMESPVFSELDKNWEDIARQLGTEQSVRDDLRKNKLLGIGPGHSIAGILETIFSDWRMQFPTEATILRLIEMLEAKDMNDIAGYLRNKFQHVDNLEENAFEDELTLTDHLDYYIVDLVQNTVLNDEVLRETINKGILTKEEVQVLKSMRSAEDRNLLFYKNVKKKIKTDSEFYNQLILIFQQDPQNHRNGISYLLNRYYG